jgi:DNA-binding response OmpR family regulator
LKGTGPALTKRVRIFLVEDHAPDVFLLKKALRDSQVDCDLIHFEDGEQALCELSKLGSNAIEPPDLVILDLNVPRIDGMGVLRAIRNDPAMAKLPVAILTSSLVPKDRMDAMASGADRFITKPVNLRSFVSIVGETIKGLIEETARR